MMKKSILYIALGMLSLTACNDEDPITPSGNYSVLRFDFPQGDNDFDHDIDEIRHKYETYMIYKDVTLQDLNRRWTSVGTDKSIWNGDPLPDNVVPYYVDFFKEHIFENLTLDIVKKALPVKIYMLENYRDIYEEENGSSGTGPAIDNSLVKTVTNGFDFWVVSFDRDRLMSQDINTLKEARCTFIYKMIKKAFDDGIIKEPAEIKAKLDLTNTFNNKPEDPDYRLTRGFPNSLYDNFREYTGMYFLSQTNTYKPSDTNNKYWFLLYLRCCLYYTQEQWTEKYSEYPLCIEIYEDMIKYFSMNYGIDMKGIQEGPEEK